MSGKPLVSVVIPAFGRTDMLRRAVESLFQQDLGPDRFEAIVVDSSPDEKNKRMVDELAASAPFSLRCVRKNPEGPGPSRNMGVELTTGEIIAFMDSDCAASPSWLREGIAAFRSDVGLVQGRTLPDPGEKLGIFRWYVRVEEENFVYETANIFYRREAFLQAGGFPADLTPLARTPMGGEDVVLAWTVKRNGWKSCFAQDALVYHEVVPMGLMDWLVIKRLYIWPSLLCRFPELRQFMFCSYFLNRAQAFFILAALGVIGGVFFHQLCWLLLIPYVVNRATEPTRSLPGPLRAARVFVYAGRDIASLVLLMAGSIRYRCLLL